MRLVEPLLSRVSPSQLEYWQAYLVKGRLLGGQHGPERELAFLRAAPFNSNAPRRGLYLLKWREASLEMSLGDFRQANDDLVHAGVVAQAAGDKRTAAAACVFRSRILLRMDEIVEARKCLNLAARYGKETGDRSLDPYILHNSGQVFMHSGQFEEALPPLQASLAAFNNKKDNADAANVLITLAWAYYRLGQFGRAREAYRDAGKMAAPGDRHLVVGHLGNLYYEQRDYAQAIRYYRQAARLAKEQDKDYYSLWLTNLASTLIDSGKWEEAETPNDEALAIERQLPSSLGLREALVSKGEIQIRRRNYPEAERTLLEVAGERGGDLTPVLGACSALADLYAKTNRPALARRQYEDALKLVDATRSHLTEDENKLSFVASLMSLHQQYVDFLMQRGDKAGAFLASESSRARVLMERLDRTRVAPARDSIADYQKAARAAGVTFLAYWVAPKSSYLWAISGDRFAAFRLPGGDTLASLVAQYQRAVERDAPDLPEDRAAGGKLYAALLSPARPFLRRGGRYIIVPDGPLYSLNFETLPAGSHYWIEDATVAIAPSLELLISRRAKPEPGKSLLLIGDADEWSGEFPKLIFARPEMEAIEHSFFPANETMLAGANATPSAYSRIHPDRFAYIHFAAHATANRDAPLDSSIILSQSGGRGKLSVKDVLNCPLRADLVTISACHSAGARTYSGEGLVGLSWAFLQSGARSVIAGLWDVSEYSSPLLMRNLYASLAHGAPPAEALRQAKLKLLAPGSKYADPYFWAPFQLYLGGLETRSALLARR